MKQFPRCRPRVLTRLVACLAVTVMSLVPPRATAGPPAGGAAVVPADALAKATFYASAGIATGTFGPFAGADDAPAEG